MNTGERLKALRKSAGISAEYIAEKIGVSPSTIYRYENNDIASMKIDKLKAIATILDTDASYLLGWQDDSSSSNHLTPSESSLIRLFRDMNGDGQQKILDYANDLHASRLYIKANSDGVDEPA